MRSFARILLKTVEFALVGALQGAVVGVLSLAPMWIDEAIRGVPITIMSPFLLMAVLAIGAGIGALAGPLVGWLLIDRVARWRAIAEPTAGAIVGCLLGWLWLGLVGGLGTTELVLGGFIGAALATLRLRYAPGKARVHPIVPIAFLVFVASCDRTPRIVATAAAQSPMVVDTPPAVHVPEAATKASTDVLSDLAARLEVPVRGVTRADLRDSYAEARGTRVHHAIDILAPRGTEVLSAVDGRLLKKYRSKAGGLMLYAADSTGQFILLYGHLDSYAADLKEGMKLTRGQVIGYVGTTGNAPANTPHLHFGILRGDPARSWSKGTAINPYRLYMQRTNVEDPLEVAVISDLNSGYGSTQYDAEVSTAVSLILQWKPDLVLVAGDMIAGQRASLTDENVRAMWLAFDSVVAAPLRAAGIPLAFTLGNHDASGHPAHARDRALAAEYWNNADRVPRVDFIDRSAFPRYYVFRMQDVAFVAIDASTGNVQADSAQLAWLRTTFASPPARDAAMRIVLGHVPLFAVAEGRNLPGEVQAQPDSLRALFERGKVRMHVSGHHHAYYPGRRGALDLLHAGAAGSGPRPLIGSTAPPYKTITLLRIFPAADSIVERSWRIEGERTYDVDWKTLPERIDGINGFVLRRNP